MKTTRTMIAALIAMLAAAPAAHAATIAYDPFTDGGVTDGADPMDLAWGSAVNVTPAVAVDATIGSGNAFVFNSTGTFSRVLAPIDPIQLAPTRDKIRIEFDLHPTVLLNTDSGIRFGIRDSTVNGSGNFDSYSGNYGTGTNTTVALLADHNSTFGGTFQEPLTPQDVDGTPSKDNNGSTLSDTGLHRAMLTVQYTEAGRVDVRARMDTRVTAAAHTGSVNTFFDQVGFSTGSNANQDFNFDNYRVTRWVNRLDDTFDFGASTLANRELDDAADPNDTRWFAINNGQTLAAVSDDGAGQIGSNNALNVDNNSSFARIAAHFEPVQLGLAARTVELSFDARIPTLPTAANGLFRFGLFNSKGTLFTGDNQPTPDDDDEGYHVQIGLGTGNTLMVQEFDGTDDVFLGGATANQTIGTGSFFINDTLPHFFVLQLTRLATGIQMQLFVDGVLVASGVDTTGPFFTFDTIAFGTGNANYDYILDNIVVDFMVPAPAALPAGLGLLGLAAVRRRRHR